MQHMQPTACPAVGCRSHPGHATCKEPQKSWHAGHWCWRRSRRRPLWHVTCPEPPTQSGADNDLANERRQEASTSSSSSSTLLHWGEYERIDWEAVHRGALLSLPLHA